MSTEQIPFQKYDQLQVSISPTREEMGQVAGKFASALIQKLLKEKEQINVMFAAAPSQNEFLAALVQDPKIDWSRVTAFHMDEYIGLPAQHPAAFRCFLNRAIFLKAPFKQVYYIDKGEKSPMEAEDIQAVLDRYTELLNAHPLDLVLMGIGENGHIAFNDPPVADFADQDPIKVVELTLTSRQQQVHDGCFDALDQVPTHAYTVTIPPMMRASYRVCIVPSALKAQAVRNTILGEVSTQTPASVLRTKESYLFIDKEAAGLLP